MATLEELEQAIIGAHKAGDTKAAQFLAGEIIKMKGIPDSPAQVPVGARAEYDALPELQKIPVALADILRLSSNAITLGNRDRFAHLLGGGTREEEVAKTDAALERSGTAGLAAQMLPAVAAPAVGAIPAIAMSAPMGAAVADARGEDMGEGAMQGLLSGVLGQVAGKAIGGIVGAGSRLIRGKQPRMTARDLAREKELLNHEVENSGVRYRSSTISKMLKGIEDATKPAIPGVHKKTVGVAKHLDKTFAGKSGSLYDIDQIQHMINRDVTKSKDLGDAEFGRRMNESVDQTLSDIEPKGILTSPTANPAHGYELVQKARDYSKRSRKLDEIEFKEEVAERRSQAKTNLSPTQAKQDQLSAILDNPGRRGGFSPDEIAKMDQVARGSMKVKALKKFGELTVPGGGTPYPLVISGAAGAGAGYMTGGNAIAALLGGGAPILAGMGAKHLANRATDRGFDELLDLISSGGKNAPDLSQFPKKLREKIAQAIAMGGILAD